MNEDTIAIRDLIAAEGDLAILVAEARGVTRVNVPMRAQVTRHDVLHVLDRWERGEVSADVVRQWADAVDTYWVEDVEAEPAHAEAIGTAIFELAHPMIEGPLTDATAAEIRARLGDEV